MAIKYRSDIDGLRAIAVLAVVLYHYGLGGLQGGFIGVDVFFVISGFLITGIIQAEMQQGKFTLAGFYERRARRIFPALFTVLLVTLLAGVFLLLPSDLARLGQAASATILFVSNALYFRQSGYFDSGSDFNALLHTWSLGVEEQFYLGLPLLLMLVHRYRPAWLLRVVALCALLSFVACVAVQPRWAKAVFFLSPFRAWELLSGGLLALGSVPRIEHRTMRNVAGVAAVLTLFGTIAFMHEGVDFPGWKAAIPVAATVLLIHVGSSGGSLVSTLLGWRPLVFVGLISYSLYLWHWPLLVFAKYRNGMAPLETVPALGLLGVAILLTTASYYWVEQPLRYWRKGSGKSARKAIFMASGAGAALLVVASVGLTASGGLPARVPPAVLALDQARSPAIPYKQCDGKPVSMSRSDCRIGVAGDQSLTLVWGDSWGIAWAPALDEVLKREGRAGVLALLSACAPLPGVNNRKSPSCIKRNAEVLAWIRQHKPERVYLIAAWPAWANAESGYPLEDPSGYSRNDKIFSVALPRTLESIRSYVRDVVLIGPTPGAPNFLPYQMAMVDWNSLQLPPLMTRSASENYSNEFWEVANQKSVGVRVIDPAPWFCDQTRCRYADSAGNLLYRDGRHLNIAGARYVATHLLAAGLHVDRNKSSSVMGSSVK